MLLNALYLVLAALALPWVAWRRCSGGRPVASPWVRFTGGIAAMTRSDARRIWMHGVSVGEVQLLAGLADEICSQASAAGRSIECVISSSTTTGLDVAARRFGEDRTFPCPLDFTWAVRRVLDTVRPDMLVLGELELWPNLLAAADALGIPIVIVNARMSERSFRGYRRIAPLVRRMLGHTSLVIARSQDDADRFSALAAPTVVTAGSMKFDGLRGDRSDPNVLRLARLAGISDDAVVFVAGSTQAPEERLALEAFRDLADTHPRLRLLIVPRHVERAEEIASLIEATGFSWQRRSRLDAEGPDPNVRILLVDTTGELGWWWGMAAIAFVGGSLDGKRGGQNMIEPAAYAAAVAFGPHTRNFKDEVRLLLEAGAAERVHSGAELTAFVRRCLDDRSFTADRGRRAAALVASQRGAKAATARLILQRLGAPEP
ncbi:MAG: 3-deoxy-D-manno-octulosonic acid transferase [Planctomycetia bacterium]